MRVVFRKYFLVLYAFVVAMDLLANGLDSFYLNAVFKPLIVISLLLYLRAADTSQGTARRYAVTGLALSLAGDVLLIFQSVHTLFFIFGLIAFLLAHLFFIGYYLRSSGPPSPVKWKRKPVWMALFALYGIGFALYLYPWLGALRLPVFAYAAVLVSLNIFALNRFGKVAPGDFRMVMAGALFFTLSDSLLAVNKFVHPLPWAGIWIMTSYALAQYLLIRSASGTPLGPGPILTTQL